MKSEELKTMMAMAPQVADMAREMGRGTDNIVVNGLCASGASLAFAATGINLKTAMLFVLQDEDEAGYFYNDLALLMGEDRVLFFPSAYRRKGKDALPDAANEILRTEVLSRLSHIGKKAQLCVVTYPRAMGEEVMDRGELERKMVTLSKGETIDMVALTAKLGEMGMKEVDYVYEPGQYAVRGSIMDVFSYNCEYPIRIDLSGDEIESIRTFEVDTQLSKNRCDSVEIVAQGKSRIKNEELGNENSTTLADYLAEGAYVVRKENVTYTVKIKTGNEKLIDKVSHSTNITFSMVPQPLFHKNFDMVRDTMDKYTKQGYRIYLLADSRKQTERLREILPKANFTPVDHTLHEGFIDHTTKACFFTDHQIFDRFHRYNLRSDTARRGKVAMTLKEINQLSVGDYVVHMDHGVGKFGGMLRMPEGGRYKEVIKIMYQNNDSVYVSIHNLYKISKYKSQENGTPPKLSRLGSGQWEKIKERTKTKLKDIARDLIKLYAERRQERGFAFSQDTYLQHELEAAFLYEDTPDQLKATNDVKADMESHRPMDRLVCGDVGFGKTEVAMRAAFKAACDSKQVAVLVPTTVLAYQHYQTFSKRLRDFPVRVEYLTRAKSQGETKEILKDLAEGRIDIIIGTHKLIGKTVKFKDLGLLIIDEEQKFGVATKEKLRQMKSNVDTLTMTATPIPRTLQFSLLGARDLSSIQTPPPNRYPITTEVDTFNHDIIVEAIRYEMGRNGQVFFVNNKISELPHLREIILNGIPEARVAIGHGQMDPEQLEDILLGFTNYDYDVLVSTTIVENGIDIPNANTIIINDAHNFGLSDLHQMRGRVGRSNRKAYCYLLAPPLNTLTTEARRRLEALENFSDLGSGINIAMQDLDIRGAGNLLGVEQSGFIADLGYETYLKVLNQAVAELRSEETEMPYSRTQLTTEYVDECVVDSDIEMYFPETFVPGDSERIMLYRELDSMKDETGIDLYRQRLRDRFGEIPQVAEELIRIVPLRRIGRQLGCERIVMKQGLMTMMFVGNNDSPYYQSKVFDSIIDYAGNNPKKCLLREKNGRRSMVVKEVATVGEALTVLREISTAQ